MHSKAESIQEQTEIETAVAQNAKKGNNRSKEATPHILPKFTQNTRGAD